MNGNEIRAARIAQGWTATDLASMLGVTRSAVSQWEHGHTTPSVPHLYALDQLLVTDKVAA